MRLISAHVEHFGCLTDETVDFAPGLCFFARPNGWGKSTLAAFIRVMFFGFEGETKRKGIENERKRFEPWQGGAYGGSLTFETGDRTYTVTRIFGNKQTEDSFELRDAATNLPSQDFSRNLGEEIFGINGESFARTVFLGQNDCVTSTTDSINARISGLTDNMNDLDSYERADAALRDAMNRLTPRRKTGLISRLNDEITRLNTEVSQNVSLEESIRACEEGEASARAGLKELSAKQESLYELQQQVSRARDVQVKQAVYRGLCDDCRAKDEALARTEEEFPGDIPSEEDIRSVMDSWDEMALLKAVTDQHALDQAKEEDYSKGKTGCIIVGVICGLMGVIFRRQLSWPWIILLAVGVVLVIAGLVMFYRKSRGEHTDDPPVKEAVPEDSVYAGLRKMGLEPGEDVRDRLMGLLKLRIEWQRAGQEAGAAHLKKEEFESANDMSALLSAGSAEGLPSLEELNDMQRRLEAEVTAAKRQAEGYGRQLAALREKYDEWQEMSERLSQLKEERKRLRQQFSHVQQAEKYLSMAKESMTAKYMEPLLTAFSEYYETVTGSSADRYHMDANTRLTVLEQGMQRDTVYLSRGYQDLIGLCLRLSLTDAMYQGEKPFLILDDPLVNLDDANAAGGSRLLKKVAERYQVIYFTCRNRK